MGLRGRKEEALWFVLLTNCHSDDQIKKREMGGTCSSMADRRGSYKVLVTTPEGKTPLERPRRRWVVNVKMDV